MAYNYLNNSYMGEPRYGATAAQQQDAQNQGNSAMSQGIQGALGLGAGLAGLYSGIQGARSANATANSAAIIRSKLPSSLYCIISSNRTGSNILDIPFT